MGIAVGSIVEYTVPSFAVEVAGVGTAVAVVVLGVAVVVVLVGPVVAGVLDVLVAAELLELAGELAGELALVVAALLVALVAVALALGVDFGTPGTPGLSSEHEVRAATLISSAIPAVMTRRVVMGSGSWIDIDAILAKTWTLVG